MSQGTRRKFSAEEKAAILRHHLVDKKPVSDVCDEYGIQPSVFYAWQRQVMDNLVSALDGGAGRRQRNGREEQLSRDNETLQAKLAKKDNVIAEVTEEFVRLKKRLGEP
jgi:transposase-like protein